MKNWPDATATARFPVVNRAGIHTRPASLIANLAKKFPAQITLSRGKTEADAKSILEVLTLEAKRGEIIEAKAKGLKAKEALVKLGELFKEGFHE